MTVLNRYDFITYLLVIKDKHFEVISVHCKIINRIDFKPKDVIISLNEKKDKENPHNIEGETLKN